MEGIMMSRQLRIFAIAAIVAMAAAWGFMRQNNAALESAPSIGAEP